jgi:adenosine kinase
MNFSHQNHIADAKGIKLGIVAPDGRDGMLQHAREFHEAGVPFIFDPGQGLPMFGGPELEEFVRLADYVTVNDYEAQMLQERTGKKLDELAKLVKALVVTLGALGAVVHTDGKQITIPSVKPEAILDPTGCGDAFRAGLLYGLAAGADWALTGRLASLMGSLKIAQRGGQNHHFTRDEAADRFQQAFGMKMW